MAKLAIHGGKQAIPKADLGRDNIEKKSSWPIITEKDKKAVMDVLDSGVLLGAFAPNKGK